ncbi:DNA/RNA non-specific endonuclease [Oribacterium sp. HCP28S3_H8]|uniref:DNA/RNA non-specific endonuclease n=1 Tax=Oribacterium sp. HCP28S3_H8 TaxID=3438945 RepID=UPI003F8A085D
MKKARKSHGLSGIRLMIVALGVLLLTITPVAARRTHAVDETAASRDSIQAEAMPDASGVRAANASGTALSGGGADEDTQVSADASINADTNVTSAETFAEGSESSVDAGSADRSNAGSEGLNGSNAGVDTDTRSDGSDAGISTGVSQGTANTEPLAGAQGISANAGAQGAQGSTSYAGALGSKSASSSAGATAKASGISLDPSEIPAYSGSPYVEINGNVPFFTENELTTASFENYSPLDHLGRCGVAYANISLEIMPTEARGRIGNVRPTGWHLVKYSGIDGNYLYNRCHLIGYQLAGENANEKNLITGTRYLNVTGMLPFENEVAEYVKTTHHHVLYRVTPIFAGENLLASGVLMEAESVEDHGAGVKFNVYCYNVQPGITINYTDGSSSGPEFTGGSTGNQSTGEINGLAGTGDTGSGTGSAGIAEGAAASGNASSTGSKSSADSGNVKRQGANYIGNSNSRKFHRPDCKSVAKMSDKNKVTFSTRDEAIADGYQPCKICNP